MVCYHIAIIVSIVPAIVLEIRILKRCLYNQHLNSNKLLFNLDGVSIQLYDTHGGIC